MKMLKRLVKILGALIALAILALLVKFYALSPKSRAPSDAKAPSTPEAIAKGKYLVDNVCGCLGCHSQIDESNGDRVVAGKLGAGRDFGDVPGFPGHIRAPNLTPDKDTGIGSFTDGELLRGMREGVGRDGHALFPQMPYLTYARTLSDDDALAIIAYLRTIAPIKNDPGKMEVNFPVSMFIRAVPQPLDHAPPNAPAPTDKIARGNWLLQTASCADCHDSVDGRRQKIPGKSFAGGQVFPMPHNKGTAIASNITADPATGIGAYSDADLRRVLNEGQSKTGRQLYVMPWSYYAGMTSEDKDALITAIRSIPAVQNPVAPSKIN